MSLPSHYNTYITVNEKYFNTKCFSAEKCLVWCMLHQTQLSTWVSAPDLYILSRDTLYTFVDVTLLFIVKCKLITDSYLYEYE